MRIRPIASCEELASTLEFVKQGLELSENHRRDLAFYLRAYGDHPGFLLIAEEGGQVWGALLASVEGDHVLIGELYVAPAHRRRGIGSGLLSVLEEAARDTGQSRLLLGAREEAEAFYLRCGFEPLLFVQVDGGDSARRLDGFLGGESASRAVVWKDLRAGLSKAVLLVGHLDTHLQKRVESELSGSNVGYLFTKEI